MNASLLEEYMLGFYGYGNLQGKYWFIGMGEGQGDTEKELKDRNEIDMRKISARINAWQRLGKNEVEDIVDFHHMIKADYHFVRGARIQSTWGGLIRILMGAENDPTDTEAVRNFQIGWLGRSDGNNCLLELFPLAAPSVSHWFRADTFQKYPNIQYVTDQQSFQNAIGPMRVRGIRSKVDRHIAQPKIVIYYGIKYKEWWRDIVGQYFQSTDLDGLSVARQGQTLYAMMPHPRYQASSHLVNIGRELANRLVEITNA